MQTYYFAPFTADANFTSKKLTIHVAHDRIMGKIKAMW